MYYDYHVHSDFSSDCDFSMEQMIHGAINTGLKELSFTDHVDYDYCDDSIEFLVDYEKYFNKLKHLQEKYKNRISIKKGIEMGLQPHLVDKCSKDIRSHDFDFVICSLHTAQNKDLYLGNFFSGKTQQEAYEDYFKDVLKVVSSYGDFSILGHLDIVRRYGNFEKPLKNRDFKDLIEMVLKKLIEKGKGIEINTSGFRYNLGIYSPCDDVLKMYKDLGGEIITLGSDSHNPNTLAYKFDDVYKDLHSAGFKYITTFEKMKPKFIKL